MLLYPIFTKFGTITGLQVLLCGEEGITTAGPGGGNPTARSMGMKNSLVWLEFCKCGVKPKDIP
jgi:hypothetical protein